MIKRQTAWMAAAATVAALALAGCGGGGGSDSGGKTKVVVWDGYEDAQGRNLTAVLDARQRSGHPLDEHRPSGASYSGAAERP